MIDQRSILFTGGSGLLGREFHKLLPQALYPSRGELDVANFESVEECFKGKNIKIVFHAAAFTSPPKVDKDPEQAIDSNIIGTCNMVKICARHHARLIYVSTDYVFSGDKGNYRETDSVHPVNKYAWSKLGGECAVKMYDNSVIIRTSFGPDEFPYDKAFVDQWTSRESVSMIAKMMLKIIESDYRGVIHIGGERKTVYNYALNLSPDKKIGRLSTSEVSFKVPNDTSLDVGLYRSIFGDE
ncbi:MAG TPA: sugar nucleotide-binding protein [Candidatus Acidoferrales bacterium]|nr:sugar nucleotide-binding protein [Candidatus Acidoferrales bacterium]